MKTQKNKFVHWFIITTFVSLYVIVSLISMIHVIDFFKLSNSTGMSIFLAIAFEVGAAASLASIIVLDKMNKGIVWSLFIILAMMQIMGNVYYAFAHLSNYIGWIELFGMQEFEPIMQKRILAIVSGAILPIVALGFIKALVDYIKPTKELAIIDNTNISDTIHTQEISNNNLNNSSNITEDKNISENFTEKSLENIQDPKLKKAANEYINKTKQSSSSIHPKTTPGIG